MSGVKLEVIVPGRLRRLIVPDAILSLPTGKSRIYQS